jgi:hypothetical protein
MQLPVMTAAKLDRELVANFETDGSRLQKRAKLLRRYN